MTDDDFSQRIAKADEDLRDFLAGRATTIGSNADAVRMFHGHIVAMRQADASWDEIAPQLKAWSGRDIAPATVKQYMTEINMGRMKLALSSTVRPQAQTPSAPPAETPNPTQDSCTALGKAEAGENDRKNIDSGPDVSDGTPIPGGFTPAPVEKWKRKT